MREVEYESYGCPLEDYQLTRADHRQQKQSEAEDFKSSETVVTL
ncbi:hypothetical protein [Streptomyces sp. NPDC048142]